MSADQYLAILRQKVAVDKAMAAIDAATDQLVLEALRLRAMYDVRDGLPPRPVAAIQLAHEVAAEYLRRTAEEHEEVR